jgi:hypothetical protein
MQPIGPRIGATGGLAVRKCPRLLVGGERDDPWSDQAIGLIGVHAGTATGRVDDAGNADRLGGSPT